MKYIPTISRAIISIIIFSIAAYSASNDFEYIMIAGLGFIYVTVDFGINNIQQRQSEAILSNLRLQLAILKTTAKPEDEIESTYSQRSLDQAQARVDEYKYNLAIQAIASLIITLGCIYLVFKALNV